MKRNIQLLLIAITLGIASCQKTTETFDRQAHRGGRALMPENTISAMKHALDMNATTLEMDVHITADSQVILSHDPYLSPTITTYADGTPLTDKRYIIYQMTYDSIQQFDVGSRPHPHFPKQQKIRLKKPRLSDLIDSCEYHAQQTGKPLPHYNIETKSNAYTDSIYHPNPQVFVDLLMQVIAEKKIQNRVIIQSFDPRTLEIVHSQYPNVKTALLVEKIEPKEIERLQQAFPNTPIQKFYLKPMHELGTTGDLLHLTFSPDIYSPDHTLVTDSMIQHCHQNNTLIIPWTVNEKERYVELKKMGVDGIITDDMTIFN